MKLTQRQSSGVGPRRPSADRTVQSVYVQNHLMFAVMHGLSPEALCASAGFSMTDVVDRDRQIPYAWAHLVQAEVVRQLQHVAVGIESGQLVTFEMLGYLGQALRHCETGLAMLELYVRSVRLLDSAYRARPPAIKRSATAIETVWPVLSPDLPECAEADFVAAAKLLRLRMPALAFHEVRFGHDRDPPTKRRLADVFRCPVRFSCSEHALVFERRAMESVLPDANALTRFHCEARVDRMLSDLADPTVVSVTRAIEGSLCLGDLSQHHVASRLGTTPRSLQRALKECGASYKDLLLETRRRRAAELLVDPSLAVYEIAFAVGYEDVTAFNRAFRKWYGTSPRAYRQTLAKPCGRSRLT